MFIITILFLVALTFLGDRIVSRRAVCPEIPAFHPSTCPVEHEQDLFKEIAAAWQSHSEHWFIKDYIVEPVGRWNW